MVLVYTEDQWGEKGCLKLTPSIADTELQVRFYYWDSCSEANGINDDEKYMLGCYTELVLVHFVDKVVID